MKPKHGKGRTGPGGIKCACCCKGRPRITKKLTARYYRRLAKKAARAEMRAGNGPPC